MPPGKARILSINGGSSNVKFALFEVGDRFRRAEAGAIERNGTTAELLLDDLDRRFGLEGLTAVGHRVVHGGPNCSAHARITPELIEELRRYSPFDPEHLPEEILLIEELRRRFPGMPQVACFDTAFHHDMPRVAQIIPIPRRYEAHGVRRYGFHGLSYEFVMGELTRMAGDEVAHGRVIVAHLGSGASLAAVRDGRPVDTSMGLTPVSGVLMSTRSGDVDPGLAWYLERATGLDAKHFNEMINVQSGLLGVSETSADMRVLLACEERDVRASEAVALFCYQVRKWIGAFAAALGGLDTLVFTGGIGANSPIIRARICEGLEFLGVEIEKEKNETSNEGLIGTSACRVAVRAMRTDEEWIIAKTVFHIMDLQRAAA